MVSLVIKNNSSAEREIASWDNILNFNVTEDYKKEKKSEWWIRQKYKLMKALKKKWKYSKKLTVFEKEKAIHQPQFNKYKDGWNDSVDKIYLLRQKIKDKGNIDVEDWDFIYNQKSRDSSKLKYKDRTASQKI